MDHNSLEAFFANKNTLLFDKQIEFLYAAYMMVYHIISEVLPIREMMSYLLDSYDHPKVEACKDKTKCGPIQMWWENTVMIYNDAAPDGGQQVGYVTFKAIFVGVEYACIGVIVGFPILSKAFTFLKRF